jgi:hypothetical protein
VWRSVFWNSLNGNYVSGWAPTSLISSTYGVDGTDYSWDIGWSFTYNDPYSGYCDTTSGEQAEILGLHTSYYGLPLGYDATTGTCSYAALACTSGYPTCNSVNYGIGFYFAPPCPDIIVTRYLVLNGNCTVGGSFDATQQQTRECT